MIDTVYYKPRSSELINMLLDPYFLNGDKDCNLDPVAK